MNVVKEQLLPGVYVVDGELHPVVSELLEDAGYARTEANIETVTRAALDVFGDLDIPVAFFT